MRDAAAWDEFIRRFRVPIFGAVLRTGQRYEQFPRGLCDDLVQETYLRLAAHNAKALRDFEPRHPGSASCYVCVIAIRVTQDYCKKKDFRRLQQLPPDPPDIPAPPEAEWLARWAQIDALLQKHATARDCQIFRLRHMQGMTDREIAAIPAMQLSEKGVGAVLLRLRRLIQEKLDPGKRE